MRICILQVKGGVGKSSISTGLALSKGFDIISNDTLTSYENLEKTRCKHIDENLKTIPAKFFRKDKDVVFDMGGMSGNIDPKIAHAVKMADCIIIPTLTDIRSINGAIETINLVEKYCNNIFVIVNRVTKEKDYDSTVDILKPYIESENIFSMKQTTLFSRIASDGDKWYSNIHNQKGSHQLLKTVEQHNAIYEYIIDITNQIVALKRG